MKIINCLNEDEFEAEFETQNLQNLNGVDVESKG